MRLRTTKTLRVFPNPWGVHPSLVIEKDPESGKTVLIKEPRLPDDPCLDPEGRPCHVVPSFDGAPKRMVGARVCEKHTKLRNVTKANHAHTVGNIWKPPQRTVYSFLGVTAYETEPHQLAAALAKADAVELPKTEQYKQRLAEGTLIPADQETADELGLPFLPAAQLFPLLSERAAAAFDKHNFEGDPAYAHFCAERAKELADPKPPAAKVEPMTSKPSAPTKGNS